MNKNRPYRLLTKGFAHRDLVVLRSLLELVDSRNRKSCVLVKQGPADVVLFDVDTPAGLTAWNTNQGLDRGTLRVWCSRQGPTEAVKYYLKKPYRYQYLVDLLETVERAKTGPGKATKAPVPLEAKQEEKRLANEVFDPAKHFLGLLLSIVEEKQPVRFQYRDNSPLYVAPAKWEYFYQGSEDCLGELCRVGSSQIQIEMIAKELLTKQATAGGGEGRSLQGLIWLAALEGSAGRPLLAWGGGEDLLKLKQWPNLGVLHHSLDEMQLAAFMTKQAATLATIVAHTGVDRKKVINFVNACYAVGLLEINASLENAPKLMPTREKPSGIYGFMRRFRRN